MAIVLTLASLWLQHNAMEIAAANELHLYSKFPDKIATLSSFSESTTADASSCSITCTNNIECISANVYRNNNDKLVCALINKTICENITNLVPSPGGVHLEIQDCIGCSRTVGVRWSQWSPNDATDSKFRLGFNQMQTRICFSKGCSEEECNRDKERRRKCQPGECIDMKSFVGLSGGVTYDCNINSYRVPLSMSFSLQGQRAYIMVSKHYSDGDNLNQSWNDYKYGFGGHNEDYFWLGNENLHIISHQAKEIAFQIYVNRKNGASRIFSTYYGFKVSSESDGYRLSFTNEDVSQNPLQANNGAKFSTFDNDNDIAENLNCANDHNSGWWFTACGPTNLNGKLQPMNPGDANGVKYGDFTAEHIESTMVYIFVTGDGWQNRLGEILHLLF